MKTQATALAPAKPAPPTRAPSLPTFSPQATPASWTQAERRPLARTGGQDQGKAQPAQRPLSALDGRPIQRKKAREEAVDNATLNIGGSGGSPLPDSVRPKMEQSFGTSFSDVKVHTNSQDALNVSAQAFTAGSDIHFAPGHFQPSSASGQSLIGHELAHVVQQRQGRVSATKQAKGGNFSLNADASLEHEADVLGAKAAEGIPLKLGKVPGPGSYSGAVGQRKVIQRNPLKKAWSAVKKFFSGKKDEDEEPLMGHGPRADDVDKMVGSHKPKSDDKYHKLKGDDEYEEENLFNQGLDTDDVDDDVLVGKSKTSVAKKYGKKGLRGAVSVGTSAPIVGELLKPVEYTLKGIAIKKTLAHRKNLSTVVDELKAKPSDQWTESEQQLYAVVDYVLNKKKGKIAKLVIPGAGVYGVVKGVAKKWQGTQGANRKTAAALLLELAGDLDDAKVSTLAQSVIIDLLKLKDVEALRLIEKGSDLDAIETLADKMLSS